MQAGAVYVPLDVSTPVGRTKFLIADCDINYLVTASVHSQKLHKILSGITGFGLVIGVNQLGQTNHITWMDLKTFPTSNPEVKLHPQDLAYIMYTSGSTGKPKGIMHTHYSGMSYARLSADLYGLNASDRISGHAPLHFDISTLAYFTGPLVGATNIIIPDAHTKMPVSLAQLVEKEQMTVWYSAPLALVQMINIGLIEERDLSNLRWVLYGGEPFSPKYLRKLMTLCPQAGFCNVYGPAEVNQCTYYFIPQPPENDQAVPIGKVWQETKKLVVDESDKPVMQGNSGELLISSSTMMDGYWKNRQLTEQSCYISENGDIFYRTGDLVLLDEEGLLHFLGRKDRQIKTRGYRVELESVEAVLTDLSQVLDAAVFAERYEPDGLLIEAAVILKHGERATGQDIRNMLKDALPGYAIPHKVYLVKGLPRTSSGKVDRQLIKSYIFKVINDE
jgi:amino acid adenylation domain-containing protein